MKRKAYRKRQLAKASRCLRTLGPTSLKVITRSHLENGRRMVATSQIRHLQLVRCTLRRLSVQHPRPRGRALMLDHAATLPRENPGTDLAVGEKQILLDFDKTPVMNKDRKSRYSNATSSRKGSSL